MMLNSGKRISSDKQAEKEQTRHSQAHLLKILPYPELTL